MAEEEKRIGVYVCHCGGNISDVVDTGKVAEVIAKDPGVVVAKDYIFMCSDPGQNMIADDIKQSNLTHVVVASCSPRLHEMTFQKVAAAGGINPFTYRHANIREQVSWVHHDHDEATEKAVRLIRGAIASATRQVELSHIEKQMIQTGLVIGGGVTGMTAALDIARAGIPVHLVEKDTALGGRTKDLDKLYPMEVDAKTFVQDLIDKVNVNELIIQHLGTEVTKTEGSIGNFTISLKSLSAVDTSEMTELTVDNGEDITLDELHVGTIIMANGHDMYVPDKGEFGYGESEMVITLPDLITELNNYSGPKDKFVLKGKEIKNVAMIHCVGSRQIDGVNEPKNDRLNTHCSRVCCTVTLQQATRLKKSFPHLNVLDLYRDIRTYGDKEKYYKDASQNNIIFVKYPDDEPPQFEVTSDMITITTNDQLTYNTEVEMDVDLVVLAVGMVPRVKPKIVGDLSLPIGDDLFLLEAHPKLRPVESATEGIFLAGTAQGTKDVKESTMSASAASAKASTLLKKEIIQLSPFVATVNEESCDASTCNTECITDCEYKAIIINETGLAGNSKQIAVIDPSACVSCGACVPVCPNSSITLMGYDIEQIKAEARAMIKEVEL